MNPPPPPRCCVPRKAPIATIQQFIFSNVWILRQVIFDIRAEKSNLAKRLNEKSNHAMYQD